MSKRVWDGPLVRDAAEERCPCIYPDVDPDDDTETCACGHVLDEHEATGECIALGGQQWDQDPT